MQRPTNLRSDAGFTIIEVLVAAAVLVTGILGTLAIFDKASKTTVETRAREAATSLARELTEAARGIQYDEIAGNTLTDVMADEPGLEDADSVTGGYQLRRRNIVYTVTLAACIMDDARDGGGDQSGGGFCAGSARPNSAPQEGVSADADRNPEDYKRVTVTVAWLKNHIQRRVTQDVIVNNPGSSAGPAVRRIGVVGHPAPVVITSGTTARITFDTSYRPATTNWTVDAAVQSPKPVATGTRTFMADWDYSALEDGTYVLGAVAFDKWGVAGQGKSITVKLNRNYARAPQGLVGGRNGDSLVELSWRANLEKDIVGYTVERSLDGGLTWATVCPLASATSCRDSAPPAPGNDAAVRYRVRSWDSDASGAPRVGPTPSPQLALPATNPAPAPPVDVRVTHLADGTAQLTWTRPVDDPADPVVFYRIYRDGRTLDSRYATSDVVTSSVQFVDGETGGVPRDYYVTAVDRWFLESAKVRAQEAN